MAIAMAFLSSYSPSPSSTQVSQSGHMTQGLYLYFCVRNTIAFAYWIKLVTSASAVTLLFNYGCKSEQFAERVLELIE